MGEDVMISGLHDYCTMVYMLFSHGTNYEKKCEETNVAKTKIVCHKNVCYV